MFQLLKNIKDDILFRIGMYQKRREIKRLGLTPFNVDFDQVIKKSKIEIKAISSVLEEVIKKESKIEKLNGIYILSEELYKLHLLLLDYKERKLKLNKNNYEEIYPKIFIIKLEFKKIDIILKTMNKFLAVINK